MSDLGIQTSRNVRAVSLVVTLIDDFTGRVITGSSARAWIENEKPPIKKAEGWNVFLDLPEGEHIVYAEGGFYNKQSRVCETGGNAYTQLKIRMTPNRTYPLPRGAAVISGMTVPNCEVLVYPSNGSASYKLLADAEEGADSVGIFRADDSDIDGKLFRIKGEDGSEEFFRVISAVKGKGSEYAVSSALTHAYSRIGTAISPVIETYSDDNGEFFIPIADVSEKECSYICESLGSEKIIEVDPKRGCSVTVDFQS